MGEILLPKRLNRDNINKWISYYKSYIAGSAHDDIYEWMISELEDLGNDKASAALDIVSNTSIRLSNLLSIFQDINKLESISNQYSDKKYNIYLKAFNKTKDKLSLLAGFNIDDVAEVAGPVKLTVSPIMKPIHSLYILASKNNLDTYHKQLLSILFDKTTISASTHVLALAEEKEITLRKEIRRLYPFLKD